MIYLIINIGYDKLYKGTLLIIVLSDISKLNKKTFKNHTC
jgi:hypothetical protein